MNSNLATCLICMKNNCEDQGLLLFDLFAQDWDNVSYLNKLQNVLTAEIDYFYYLQVVFDETLICSTCLNDLNRAYEFKEKVLKALDYWNTKFEESVTFENKINEEAVIDVNDNNEIIESNNYIEDIINTNEIQVEHSDQNDCNDVIDITKENEVENEIENNIEYEVEDEVQNEVKSEDKIEANETVDSTKKTDSQSSNIPCSKCNSEFLTALEVANHVCNTDIKDEIEEKPKKRKKQKSDTYKCDTCNVHFSKLWKLNKHCELHALDKKFVCTFCDHSFKQSYHLREHLTTHTGERNFCCEVCGKKFQRMSSQKRHMRTHNLPPGEKCKKTPFLCNICGKSFPYSNGAQRHMRIHTGDKRYGCDVCGKKFNQSTHLKVHLRMHTGERPYACEVCGYTFTLKAALHKHMKGHSENKNDVKILQNLEPNLSQTQCINDNGMEEDEKKDFIIDDLYDQGFMIACSD